MHRDDSTIRTNATGAIVYLKGAYAFVGKSDLTARNSSIAIALAASPAKILKYNSARSAGSDHRGVSKLIAI